MKKHIKRHFDDGGMVSGPIMGDTQGRDDTVSTNVEDGSHIVPADVVSSIGDGNTMAGMKKLSSSFPNSNRKTSSPSISELGNATNPMNGLLHNPMKMGKSIGMHQPKMPMRMNGLHSNPLKGLRQPHMSGLHSNPVMDSLHVPGLEHIGKIGHLKSGGESDKVPVKLSHGEFSIHTKDVERIGDGDIEKGHQILNHMIITIRAMDIKRRQGLPKPE